jgi:hypothetical protein
MPKLPGIIERGQENMNLHEQIRAEGPIGWHSLEQEFCRETRFQFAVVERDTASNQTDHRLNRVEARLAGGQFLIHETFLPE